jgi:hypothetical protein
MEAVKRTLTQIVGNRADFDTRAAGIYEAKTADNVESQAERKVVVSVWEPTTTGAGPTGSTPP